MSLLKRLFATDIKYLLCFVLLIYPILIHCSEEQKPKKESKEVINYIPQPGISVENGRLGWAYSSSLPSPFANSDGSVITTSDEWEARRSLLLEMLEEYVYGPRPGLEIQKVEESYKYHDTDVADNAITHTVSIYYDESRHFKIRVTRPEEPGIYPVIMRYESNDSFRFPIEEKCIGDSRYVIVALNNLTVAPDEDEITSDYMCEAKAIMAWAYAASLTVDYLETLDFADCKNITITGMSRTGKAAICAGIYDERFTIIVANSSGAAGASGFRNFGEDGTQAINIAKHEPTWVSEKLLEYLGDASELPLDMHFARALIAPRVILTTEAADGAEAIWAGPVSTFKMWKASDFAFELYNKVENNLIHLRDGEHAQLNEDYDRMILVVNHICYGDPLNVSIFRKSISEY